MHFLLNLMALASLIGQIGNELQAISSRNGEQERLDVDVRIQFSSVPWKAVRASSVNELFAEK